MELFNYEDKINGLNGDKMDFIAGKRGNLYQEWQIRVLGKLCKLEMVKFQRDLSS